MDVPAGPKGDGVKTFGDTCPHSPSVAQERNQLLVPIHGTYLGQPSSRTVWPPYYLVSETLKGSKCLRVLSNRSCQGAEKHVVVLERVGRTSAFSPTGHSWPRRWSHWYTRHGGCASAPAHNAYATETGQPPVIPSWDEERSCFPVFLRTLPTSFSEENYFNSTVAHVRLRLT